MKKLLFLFVATASLLVSCDKDDNNVADNSSLLLGKWEAKSFTAEATMNGTPIPMDDVEIGSVVGTVFEFTANNVVKITTYEEFDENDGEWTTEQGTYVYNVAQREVVVTLVDEVDQTTYTQVMKVNLLNNSNFNFRLEETETYEGIVFKLTMDVNCERKN